MPGISALELGQFTGFVFPVVCVDHGGFAFGDAWPTDARELRIQGRHVLLIGRHVLFGVNGIDGALGNANRTIDALIGVDGQKIGAFAETIDRTNVHTVGVFAADTRFGDNVGHDKLNRWVKEGAQLRTRADERF